MDPFRITLADLERGFELAVPPAAVALAFSAFGITGVGASELFAYPYWCIEKGYARYTGVRSRGRSLGHAGAGLDPRDAARRLVQHGRLHGRDGRLLLPRRGGPAPAGARPQGPGDDPDPVAHVSAAARRDAAGSGLRPFTRVGFLLGAWAVLFKTLYVATAANSRLTADFLDLLGLWQTGGPAQRDRLVKLFCVLYPTLALGLYLRLPRAPGLDQGRRDRPGADASVHRRRDALPPPARHRPPRRPVFLTDILTWLAFFAITAVAVYSTFDQVKGLLPALTGQPSTIRAELSGREIDRARGA